MKKVIILTTLLSLFLTGCWDLNEVEKLGMVSLIGIDMAENQKVRVLIQETSPSKGVSSSQKGDTSGKLMVELHQATAPTITDAVEKINTSSLRMINFAHTNAIILSAELVRSVGVQPFMDFLERTPSIRRNVWLLISKEGQFDKICNPNNVQESNAEPGKIIIEIIHNKPAISTISAKTIGEFLNLLWENGSDTYTSGINLMGTGANDGNQNADTGGSDSKKLDLENTAIFKNGKFAGWLNDTESRGLLWAKGEIKGGTLTVNSNGKQVTLGIKKASSKIEPRITDGKMEADIWINVQSTLAESLVNSDYTDTEAIKNLQNLQGEEIKKQIIAAYEKTKEVDSDVFGFGNYFFGKYSIVWREIEVNKTAYYRDIQVNIHVNSTVKNIGLVKKTAKNRPVD